MERGGFEPPKASPTDLQSVPFGRSGTSPNRNHYLWIEQIPPGKEKDWEINDLHKWSKDQHESELIMFNKIQFFCQEIFFKKTLIFHILGDPFLSPVFNEMGEGFNNGVGPLFL